jgi:hypothetical protein
MSRLPQCQFMQSDQRLFPEKILQGLFGLIDDARLRPIDESFLHALSGLLS